MLQSAFNNLFRLREKASRSRPGADDGFDPHEKPFLDHLEDLRHTLMKIVATLSISTVACFAFHKQIFQLVQIPAKMKLAEISPGVSLWDKLELITLGPTEFIVLMLKLSFFSGLIVTFPFTVFFLFQFIIPGLRQSEKRAIIPGVGIGFILFLIGAAFAFFGAAPIALKYFYVFENSRISNLDPLAGALERPVEEISLVGFDGSRIPPVGSEEAETTEASPDASTPAKVEPELSPELRSEVRNFLLNSLATADGANFALRYDETRDKLVLVAAKGGRSSYQIGKYIGFITQLVLVFGISFQMPIVVTILVKLELLTARVMRDTRTYAWIVILVAAAILTPPDVLTLALLGGPLILLYEICIIIATVVERIRDKNEKAEEQARQSRLEELYSKSASDLTEEEKAELHRAEIEQYEREHAHLYEEENEHVSRDNLHGEEDDPHHGNHDESWHADGQYWHDDSHYQDYNDPHHGMESDHAEPEDLKPGEGEGDSSAEDSGKQDHHSEYENCAPEGPVVDLNYASIEELQTLPGVGPKLAQVLIDHRPYETFDDLDRVPGLGPEKIRRITERIMLG
ncbi:MAG: twin-arginine translocase subunit TatC [Verrucomicrobiae bacterium]|nr:twin-arginine translocase subunit TatC [Verrucomicrobiae bacterium]